MTAVTDLRKLIFDELYFECPICLKKSYSPSDRRYGYCGNCHAFTRDCAIGSCECEPVFIFGNVALCKHHADEIIDAVSDLEPNNQADNHFAQGLWERKSHNGRVRTIETTLYKDR